jgi:hypothetical protein
LTVQSITLVTDAGTLAIVPRGDLAAMLRFAANKKTPTSFRRSEFWAACCREHQWLRGQDLNL